MMSSEGSRWVFTEELHNVMSRDIVSSADSHRVGAGGGNAGDISAWEGAGGTRSGSSPVFPARPVLPGRSRCLWRSPTRWSSGLSSLSSSR